MRRLLRGAGAAALASGGLAWAAPAGDAFRPTLALLPWVVLALREVERWAERRAAERAPAGGVAAVRWGLPPAVEGSGLTAVVFLVLGREHLGLYAPAVTVEGLLAAALMLLLVHRLGRLWPALAPALPATVASRPGWIFFALPLTVYLAVLPWSAGRRPPDGDEPYYLLLAHSLAYDLDADLANNYAAEDSRRFMPRALAPEWPDPRGPDGEIYSRHNLLLPLLLAPAYRLAGRWGVLALMALAAAAAAWLFLRVLRRLWPRAPEAVLAAWGLFALAPPFLLYSHQVWVEVPAVCLLVLALDRLHALQALETGENARRSAWLVFALVLAALPLLKLRLLLVSVGLVALAWWRLPRARRVLSLLSAGVVAVGAGMLLYNHAAFGTPFKDHTWRQVVELQAGHPERYPRGAAGLFFDGAFGLFAVAPVWLLALPGAAWLALRRRRLLAELLLVALPYLAVVTPRLEWYGAWSPPFRLGLVLLPLAGIALVPALARCRRAGLRAALAALGALTLGLTALWLAVPGWTYNLADGTGHLAAYLNERLGADAGRFLPSFIRPRAASLWGPLAALAALAALSLPRRPRRTAARAGVAGLLATAALLPLAATGLPTRTIEFEDRHVRKSGGEIYPPPWAPGRSYFRGGWILDGSSELSAPLVPGAGRVDLELDLRILRRATEGARLELSVGDSLHGAWPVETGGGWQEVAFELPAWRERQPLVLRLVQPTGGPGGARLLLDRARLRWRGRG